MSLISQELPFVGIGRVSPLDEHRGMAAQGATEVHQAAELHTSMEKPEDMNTSDRGLPQGSLKSSSGRCLV